MATELLDARAPGMVPIAERPVGPPAHGPRGRGADGGGPNATFDPGQFGLWAFLGTVSMLFIGFTSAYIVRRTGIDWRPLPLPRLLWGNTAALLLSSVALEVARRPRPALALSRFRLCLRATALPASLFLPGHFQALRLLRALGRFP